MSESNAGLSLIEVLIGLAVVSLLTMATSTIYLSMLDSIGRDRASREQEEVRNYVQGILDRPVICDTALKAPGGGAMNWPSFSTPVSVGSIFYNGNNVITAGANFSKVLKIKAITLRAATDAEGGAVWSGPYDEMGGTYLMVSAKVQIDYVAQTYLSGDAPLRSNKANVVLLVNTTTNTVDHCGQTQKIVAENVDCSTYTLCPAPHPIMNNGGSILATAAECPYLKYVSHFDEQGVPKCACVLSCIGGPQGPPGDDGNIVPTPLNVTAYTPTGSFRLSCSACAVTNFQNLSCSCTTIAGTQNSTTLDLSTCAPGGGVSNINGNLTCGG